MFVNIPYMPTPSLTPMNAHLVLSGPCWHLPLRLQRPQPCLNALSCRSSMTTLPRLRQSRCMLSSCSAAHTHTGIHILWSGTRMHARTYSGLQGCHHSRKHACTHVHTQTCIQMGMDGFQLGVGGIPVCSGIAVLN